jgi:two-component system cell cycle response regulator
MKMLIADDDPMTRRMLEATLQGMGHQVCAVDDGAAALKRLAEPGSPRIAILDWMMPGLDGLSVCRSLRQAVGPYTYVILLTARETRRDMVEALDAGADDFLTKPLDVLELRARLRSGERIIALQEDLLRTQSELEHQASHDRLTGLWNRGRVLDQLTRELYRTKRERACLAVVMADIDHFKRINDTWGHATGDAVLCDLGQRMQLALRVSDAIGRYGGEEFLMVLPRADLAGGSEVAERVRRAVEGKPVAEGGHEHQVTVSLGVASSATSGFDPAVLIRAADRALYRAKADGRNRVGTAEAPPASSPW